MSELRAQVDIADAPTSSDTDANQERDAPQHHERSVTGSARSDRNVAQEAREQAVQKRANTLPPGFVPLKGRRFPPGETPTYWQTAPRSIPAVDEVPLGDHDREDDAAGREFDHALGRAAVATIAAEMGRRGSPPRLIAASS